MTLHPKLRRYVEGPPRVWPSFVLAFAFGLALLAGAKALMASPHTFRCFASENANGAPRSAPCSVVRVERYDFSGVAAGRLPIRMP